MPQEEDRLSKEIIGVAIEVFRLVQSFTIEPKHFELFSALFESKNLMCYRNG